MATPNDILRQYKPSFLEGMARAFDIFGYMPVYECRDSSHEAVANALARDWMVIGEDLRRAMLDFEEEHGLDVLNRLEAVGVTRDTEAA